MRILTNLVDTEILISSQDLSKQVLIIELAGRTCYKSYEGKEITLESARKFIKMLIGRHHESVMEHSLVTVRIRSSIGETREQNRHRLASPSEQSTRYVNKSDLAFVFPPHRNVRESVTLKDGRVITLTEAIQFFEDLYSGLIDQLGWVPEDARQFLPLGTQSEIVISANFREWRHIMELRTNKAAHWEIRSIMCHLLEVFKDLIPGVFDDFALKGKDKNGVPFFIKKRPTATVLEDIENSIEDFTQEQREKLLRILELNRD